MRKAAGVADNVPVRGADDLARTMGNSRAGREALENSARRITRSTDPAVLQNTLRTQLNSIDPALVRYADELGTMQQQYLLVAGRGATTTRTQLPDMLQRAAFIERGGADTLVAIGMHGDGLARSAMRLDAAIQGGRVISPTGMRQATLQDFGRLFTTHGDAAHTFWTRYVVPHWNSWLIGGAAGCALAWYLIDPEGFMDTAGNLTEEGFKRLGEVAGHAAAGLIKGISEGATTAAEKIGDAATESMRKAASTMFFSWSGFVGSIVILFGIACCIPFTRYYVLRPFRFLFRSPSK